LSPIAPTPYIKRIAAFKSFAVKAAMELDRLCKPELEAALKTWQTKNRDAHVVTFSLADLYREWKENMPKSGFTNMDDKCAALSPSIPFSVFLLWACLPCKFSSCFNSLMVGPLTLYYITGFLRVSWSLPADWEPH
jgi:hypothetical protein